jgi:hypothetical protein
MRWLVLALSLTACQAVPDITYVDGGDNTCPSQVPSYATICCGPVPCFGANCVAAQADCEQTCKPTDLCCPNAQNHAVCSPNQQCP